MLAADRAPNLVNPSVLGTEV